MALSCTINRWMDDAPNGYHTPLILNNGRYIRKIIKKENEIFRTYAYIKSRTS